MKSGILQILIFSFLLSILTSMSGCTDKESVKEVNNPGINFHSTGSLTLNMLHYFGDSLLKFSPEYHITKANDTIKVSELKYYISHVRLYKSDGSSYDAANYVLMDASTPTKIILSGIPKGNYISVGFYLGVDPAYNHSLDHPYIDALDPSHGMSWGWSTGYIFTRVKGYHGQQLGFSLDIGGDDALIDFKFDLKSETLVSTSVELNFKVDLKEFFENPNTYDLKTQTTAIHTPTDPEVAILVANEKIGMFNLKSMKDL